jgi:hypothetical protein
MPFPTTKDRQRMETLAAYARENGLTAANAKAQRDAEKIESVEKCENRAFVLEQFGLRALAQHFRNRAQWLRAQGVTA